ncbi:MAG: SGNH/GDSL hydrolase family protein [Gloeobacteraceae cyanobacterium ES-bin-316]|nr:SGNH/GDSL hydrolase family protein [Ferruginibacter sp.]
MNQFKVFVSPLTLLFSLLILVVCLGACKKSTPVAVGTNPPVNDTVPTLKSYLALGDSYTIGQSVATDQRFPFQTAVLLTAQGISLKQPFILATTGWTTGSLLSALAANPPANNYDIVSLLIGVNNQYQGRSQDEYRIEFTALLNKAIDYAAGRKNRVFVLSIPDYSVTPFAQNSDTAKIAREINEFNFINKQITTATGVSYLDITPISREARSDVSLIAADGLHPSGKQYQRWSALLTPLIKAAF